MLMHSSMTSESIPGARSTCTAEQHNHKEANPTRVAPASATTPGSPGLGTDPLALFKRTSAAFCASVAGHKYAYAANNVSLEQCASKCIEIGCAG